MLRSGVLCRYMYESRFPVMRSRIFRSSADHDNCDASGHHREYDIIIILLLRHGQQLFRHLLIIQGGQRRGRLAGCCKPRDRKP